MFITVLLLMMPMLISASESSSASENSCNSRTYALVINGDEFPDRTVGFERIARDNIIPSFGDNVINGAQPVQIGFRGSDTDTLAAISAQLETWQIRCCDKVILYINSHGGLDENGKSYIALHDGDDPRNNIDAQELSDFIEEMQDRFSFCNVLLIADTCHAGQLQELTGIPGVEVVTASSTQGAGSCSYGSTFAKGFGPFVEQLVRGDFSQSDAQGIESEIKKRLREAGNLNSSSISYSKSSKSCNCEKRKGVKDALSRTNNSISFHEKQLNTYIQAINKEKEDAGTDETQTRVCERIKGWKNQVKDLKAQNDPPSSIISRQIADLERRINELKRRIKCPEDPTTSSLFPAPEFSTVTSIAVFSILLSIFFVFRKKGMKN